MSLPKIAEVFGYAVEDTSSEAVASRARKHCPFRNSPCTKASKNDPLGICSLGSDGRATVLCPVRFIDRNRIFIDAARMAFGPGVRFGAVPEVRILRIGSKKIGKVDFLLARLDEENQVKDFAAVEVQAVYFSGGGMRPQFQHFLDTGALPDEPGRRPDYRSSAQKRLMPQLALKVPVFRRWGKRFFVVVDQLFFQALPRMKECAAANTEITWLVYPLNLRSAAYQFDEVQPFHSQWEDVMTALREGLPPEPHEIISELQLRLAAGSGPKLPLMST
ncbi:MAG: hypothetical protein HC850_09085 [Rhodomicrobium sp.]|nr:hypothetical protein [Rhodomicrobium sp.]